MTFFNFNSHLHCLVPCCRSGPHFAKILVVIRYYHLSSTMLVKQEWNFALRNLHITRTSQVESITVFCFSIYLEIRGRWTHATTNGKEFIRFHFKLVQLRKISLISAKNQSFFIQSFQLIRNDFLIQQKNGKPIFNRPSPNCGNI